jgi:hypothetical protein
MRVSRSSVLNSGIVMVWLVATCLAQLPYGSSNAGSGNARDPRQTLMSAKTAAIVAQNGEVAQTGRWVMDPSPERAANALQKALQKWGRLAVVEDSVQADLVLLIIEGNRSSFLKKGELFEKLIVLPGGPGAVQEKTPLWQEEAKEGLGGRPAGKLVEHLRKQVEDYEKAGPPVMSVQDSHSEPAAPVVATTTPPTVAPAVSLEMKTVSASETVAPVNASSTTSAVGGRLENRMLQPVPDKFVPSRDLLMAKTVAIVAFGPQPEGGTKGFIGGMLTGTTPSKQANALRARKDVEGEVSKWKRYTLVENPVQADIVVAVREWNHTGIFGREYLACRMAVFKGGPDFERDLQMLWAEEYETDFGSTTKIVAKDFRRVVEKLGKQTNR